MLKQEDNLINKKKVKNFLSRKACPMEIELRVDEFLNARTLFFLKNIIQEGCVSTKLRGGTILQEKDLRFNIFKSKNIESLEHNFWKKHKLSKKKGFGRLKKKKTLGRKVTF